MQSDDKEIDDDMEGMPKGIADLHRMHRAGLWSPQPWRAWGSWFSWGSPVGLGLFFIEMAAFLWILHMAGLLR